MTTPGDDNSSGGNGKGKPKGIPRPLFLRGPATDGRKELTPEQGCIGCLVVTAIIVVSLIFWGYVFWRNSDVFQPPPSEVGGQR